MSLGKIFGNITPKEFKFLVSGEVKPFQYVKINHKVYGDVLAQIIDLEENQDITTASCKIIGYFDKKHNRIKSPKIPLETTSEVFIAEDEFIEKVNKP